MDGADVGVGGEVVLNGAGIFFGLSLVVVLMV